MEKIEQICKVDYLDEGIALINDMSTLELEKLNASEPDAVLIAFIREGFMTVEIDGTSERVSDHQLLFLTPGRNIGKPFYSNDFIGHAVLFTVRFGQQIITTTGNLWIFLNRFKSNPVMTFPASVNEVLKAYYNLLVLEARRENNLYRNEIIPSLFRNLLYTLISDLRQTEFFNQNNIVHITDSYDGSPQAIAQFHRFINILTTERCTHRKIQYYADRLCMSSKYLSTICKQISRRTARQWICDSMANGIESHLRYSDLTIKEISILYGFPNMSVFSKFVKKQLGMSPNSYRK